MEGNVVFLVSLIADCAMTCLSFLLKDYHPNRVTFQPVYPHKLLLCKLDKMATANFHIVCKSEETALV